MKRLLSWNRTLLVAAALTVAAAIGVANLASAQVIRPREGRLARNSQGQNTMTIDHATFGTTTGGKKVEIYTLANGSMSVKILTLGGAIYEVNIPDRDGNVANVVANMKDVADYEATRTFFGALVGRYANRIAKGKFTLDGREYTLPVNNGENALHGGLKGLDLVVWKVEKAAATRDGVTLALSYFSRDGEEGYPGNMKIRVVYTLTPENQLKIDYTATTDKNTVLNLTNHAFWNLAGKPSASIKEHVLMLNADRFLPTDAGLIPTGEVKNVEGTPLDFQTPTPIGQRIADITEPQFAGGYDHCLVLKDKPKNEMSVAAKLVDPQSGRTMTIETTEPAIQFYSGNFLEAKETSADGWVFPKHSLLCLETQHYPDSPNHPDFPSTILKPGQMFRSTTVHTFGVEK
ncbi:MAG: aldose epimerase family protein [Thermoguttaceae bacterium]